MPSFSDINSLCQAVENTFPNILENQVYPVAVEIFRKHVDSDIYGAYTPSSLYARRGNIGSNIYREITTSGVGGYELGITSAEPAYDQWVWKSTKKSGNGTQYIYKNVPNGWTEQFPGAFMKMLEGTNFGLWKGGFPRPVITNTQNEYSTSSAVKAAIKAGIKAHIG